MRRALVISAALLLGASALATACGGEGEEPESLSADELVARAYEAMTKESFALSVPPEPASPQPSQPPYSIKYGPPDLLLITGGGYERPAYLFLVGKETYISETGRQWRLTFGGGDHTVRLFCDPREFLRIATDLRDEGTQALDGKPHRVVAARPDAAKFFDKYLADVVELVLSVEILDYPCPTCTLTFDRTRLQALGYRNPDGYGFGLFKGQEIRIKAYAESMMFWVRGIRELSPALKDEFRQLLEAYSVDPTLLDKAEVTTHEESMGSLEEYRMDEVKFWIDPKTLLVSKVELHEGTYPVGELIFLEYGKVKLPKPEPAMLNEEADLLFGVIQDRWRPLAEALEAYAGAHGGLYPNEVTPQVLQEALESEGLEWPDNAFTGEPMQESPERNPGDFHYQPSPDRLRYCAEVYEWERDGVPVAPHGAAGMPCPTPTPSSP